jgi:DNA-directed RNA polymerase subunit RPC12/RpoP
MANNLECLSRSQEKCDKSHYYWHYRCLNCGGEFLADKGAVNKGRKHCPHCKKPKGRSNWIDYTGQLVNGTVQIVKEVGTTDNALIQWEAICLFAETGEVCGKTFTISSEAIRKGNVSCGCAIEHHNAQQTIERILQCKIN